MSGKKIPFVGNQQKIARKIDAILGVIATDALSATATSDGLTTGLLVNTTKHSDVTSSSANNLLTLPDATTMINGQEGTFFVGANGLKLRTLAGSGTKINNVDTSSTARAAIAANSFIKYRFVNPTVGYIIYGYTNLGAALAAIVPA